MSVIDGRNITLIITVHSALLPTAQLHAKIRKKISVIKMKTGGLDN